MSTWMTGMTGNLVADAIVVFGVYLVGQAVLDRRVANGVLVQVGNKYIESQNAMFWVAEMTNATSEVVLYVSADMDGASGDWTRYKEFVDASGESIRHLQPGQSATALLGHSTDTWLEEHPAGAVKIQTIRGKKFSWDTGNPFARFRAQSWRARQIERRLMRQHMAQRATERAKFRAK